MYLIDLNKLTHITIVLHKNLLNLFEEKMEENLL